MDKLASLIAKHEGLRLKVYKDTVGIETIGYGRNLVDVGITPETAEMMLQEDIDRSIEDADKFEWFARLNEVRQAVIIDMLFNLGLTRFKKFKHTIIYINSSRYADASREMLNSKWAKQVGDRAIELSDMMRTGVWA